MSTNIENNAAGASVLVADPNAAHGGHDHDPHLAHHFDTLEQQYQSGKLGMWVFLGTELLMFGGLFCAYSVYRHNHPDVFLYAHEYLDKTLGAINTLVLITSSLTMAWGVRAAQLNKRGQLMVLLALTLLGGLGFMCIKSIEYTTKWKHHLFIGSTNNVFNANYHSKGGTETPAEVEETARHLNETEAAPAPPAAPVQKFAPGYVDGNAGSPDEAQIKPPSVGPAGLAPKVQAESERVPAFNDLINKDKDRVYTFFGIYFFMTGLHGVHVLVGMALIGWILLRASRNEFSPRYFAPIDLVGLYWHLVDLIWIFLFPLLYLIH